MNHFVLFIIVYLIIIGLLIYTRTIKHQPIVCHSLTPGQLIQYVSGQYCVGRCPELASTCTCDKKYQNVAEVWVGNSSAEVADLRVWTPLHGGIAMLLRSGNVVLLLAWQSGLCYQNYFLAHPWKRIGWISHILTSQGLSTLWNHVLSPRLVRKVSQCMY